MAVKNTSDPQSLREAADDAIVLMGFIRRIERVEPILADLKNDIQNELKNTMGQWVIE